VLPMTVWYLTFRLNFCGDGRVAAVAGMHTPRVLIDVCDAALDLFKPGRFERRRRESNTRDTNVRLRLLRGRLIRAA
jgi:hypothetical protein